MHSVTLKEMHSVTLKEMHSVTLKEMHSVTPKEMHSVTPREMHSVTLKEMHSVTPREMHSVTPTEMHSVTPTEMHSVTLREMHSVTPKEMHSERWWVARRRHGNPVPRTRCPLRSAESTPSAARRFASPPAHARWAWRAGIPWSLAWRQRGEGPEESTRERQWGAALRQLVAPQSRVRFQPSNT
jgi:hypothetical protein